MTAGPIAFVLNASAGSGAHADWFQRQRATLEAMAGARHVTLAANGEEIHAAVRRALQAGCRRVVAGGGDGTINAVAGHLVGRADVALGVLPLGTLNHFAKDVGVPVELDAALQVLTDGGQETAVDIGEVNGRFFVNNSSLGLYPAIVRHREQQQHRLGRGKWPAFAWAVLGVLRRYPFLDVRMVVDGEERFHRTPFVFIGNNEYRMDGLSIGRRACLSDGLLSVYVAQRTGRLGLLRLALRALLGRLAQAGDFSAMHARDLHITTRRRHLRVATDGEVQMLSGPLHYRVHVAALRVIVPRT
jgi:diacylglycerol kinase family enzyme